MESKRPRGRPRTLDDLKKAEIVRFVEHGLSLNRIADGMNFHASTISRERDTDSGFNNAIKRAELDCEALHVGNISSAQPRWQSSAWFLERKWPKVWGQKATDQVDGLSDLLRQLINTEKAEEKQGDNEADAIVAKSA